MRMIFVYLRNSSIFIQAMAKTEGFGVWISNGPVFKSSFSDPCLGEVICAAFQFSVEGVKHPSKENWPLVVMPLLEAAGVKSSKTFEKGCKSIKIMETNGECTLRPSYRGDEQLDKIRTCKLNPLELFSKIVETFPDAEFIK